MIKGWNIDTSIILLFKNSSNVLYDVAHGAKSPSGDFCVVGGYRNVPAHISSGIERRTDVSLRTKEPCPAAPAIL